MSYSLSLKVHGCSAPLGDYYFLVALNKVIKKDRNETKTEVLKKVTNPSWMHEIEMYDPRI